MKICLDSVSGDPSLLRMSITRWKLQLTTSCYKYGPLICQTGRASYYSSICALALMFGVTIQTEVSRDATPALDQVWEQRNFYLQTGIQWRCFEITILRLSLWRRRFLDVWRNNAHRLTRNIYGTALVYIHTDVGHHANPSITINSGWFMTNLITSNLVLAVDTSNGQWRRWKIMQRSWYSIKWWVISILR